MPTRRAGKRSTTPHCRFGRVVLCVSLLFVALFSSYVIVVVREADDHQQPSKFEAPPPDSQTTTTAFRYQELLRQQQQQQQQQEESQQEKLEGQPGGTVVVVGENVAAVKDVKADGGEDDGKQCGYQPGVTMSGKCAGGETKPVNDPSLDNPQACAKACCGNPECITWQFRKTDGCLHGPDVRLGMEKDGPSAWCEPVPPARWQGERVRDTRDGANIDHRAQACGDDWKPDSLSGQCFGLGAQREGEPSNSAESCRRACCDDGKCRTWQYREDKGCFFTDRSPGCDEEVFEAYVGGRKIVPGRTYTDMHGKKIDYS